MGNLWAAILFYFGSEQETIIFVKITWDVYDSPYVSSQMTLIVDEVIFHKICATFDIETIYFLLIYHLHPGESQGVTSKNSYLI